MLSGGGARGAAHVGVLKVLDEMRVPIDAIAGTSMGAVVGGLYASGMSGAEIETLIRSLNWQDAFRDRPPREELGFRRKQDDRNFLVRYALGVNEGGLRAAARSRAGAEARAGAAQRGAAGRGDPATSIACRFRFARSRPISRPARRS